MKLGVSPYLNVPYVLLEDNKLMMLATYNILLIILGHKSETDKDETQNVIDYRNFCFIQKVIKNDEIYKIRQLRYMIR